MDEFVSITKELVEVKISEKDRKFLLRIINDYSYSPRIKNKSIHKIKSFFGISDNKHQKILPSEEVQNLIQQRIIEKNEKPYLSTSSTVPQSKSNNQYYRITDNGLVHIFSNRYLYPPNLLLSYQNNTILQKILYQFFEPITIKHATAKFFNIITDYLSNVSGYLIIFSKSMHETITENQKLELQQNMNMFSQDLAFKIAILFNEANLIAPVMQLKDEKAILVMYEIETKMKRSLSTDKKFQNLLSKTYNDFYSGYEDLSNSYKK